MNAHYFASLGETPSVQLIPQPAVPPKRNPPQACTPDRNSEHRIVRICRCGATFTLDRGEDNCRYRFCRACRTPHRQRPTRRQRQDQQARQNIHEWIAILFIGCTLTFACFVWVRVFGNVGNALHYLCYFLSYLIFLELCPRIFRPNFRPLRNRFFD